MKQKLLVIGSFNFDQFYYVSKLPLPGETIDAYDFKVTFGGKGFNQAVASSKINNEIELFCVIGNDFKEGHKRYLIDKYHIKNIFYKKKDFKTGSAHIVVDKVGNNQIIVLGGANKQFNEELCLKLDNLLKNYNAILMQNEISEQLIDFLFKRFGNDKTIFYNAAPAKHINEDYYQYIDYLFVNEVELKQLSKCEIIDDGISKLLSKGIKNIIVTLGKNGALFLSKNEYIKKDSINVNSIDTVGAGDTFVGYFVGAIMKGLTNQKAMDLATIAAGLSTTKKGAAESVPNLEDVLSYH